MDLCSIMIWVKVPPKGEGLRSLKSNKYIIAHTTGAVNERGWPYNNRFSLGLMSSGCWEVRVSNNCAEQDCEVSIGFADVLDSGWHHFMIAWDRSQPIIEFIIDGGKSGKDLAKETFFSHWPTQLTDKVIIGGWASENECFYCETELYQLLIYNKYIDTDSEEYKNHKKKQPSL